MGNKKINMKSMKALNNRIDRIIDRDGLNIHSEVSDIIYELLYQEIVIKIDTNVRYFVVEKLIMEKYK